MTINSMIGARVKRKEDLRLITGRATYVDDVKLANMLYASFVRSPYAHGRVTGLDFLNQFPDCQIFRWDDFKDTIKFNPVYRRLPNRPYLSDGVVRMAGEMVALVVAPTAAAAEDQANDILVDLEQLPVIVNPEEALKTDAPLVYSTLQSNLAKVSEKGDRAAIAAIIDACPIIVEERIYNQRLAAISLETRGIVADYNRGNGQLTVWLSNQAPHLSRSVFAAALNLPEHRVRVIAPEVGGGFGAKITVYPEEIIVAAAAVKLGRSIKWVENRTENLIATYHGRNQIDYVRIGATEEGIIKGLELRLVADIGAYANDESLLIPSLTALMASGCYAIKNIYTRIEYVYTNTTPMTAYRGAGRPEASYLVERMMDALAARLQLDPPEVRRRNFIKPNQFPYKSPTSATYDSGDYLNTMEVALQSFGYEEMRSMQAQRRAEAGGKLPHKLMGIGMGSYVERGSMGFENSVIRVHPDGSVMVFTGTSPHGQGGETTMAQIVADTLGISMERIEVSHGDTKETPYGQGTYGSRSVAVGGSAVRLASLSVRDKMVKLAAHMLEASENDIEVLEGSFSVKGVPGSSRTFVEIARTAYQPDRLPADMEMGLESSRYFNAPDLTFPFGTHICALEINTETGEVEFIKYVSVDDCGNVINPMIVDGQIHGGLAQGISQALYEEVVYDEDGQLLSGSLMDYTFPTATELPPYTLNRTFTPSPLNPLGSKGIGESGATGSPPAVVNAVLDALRPYGVTNLDMPLRHEKLWKIISELS
ncbi:MAG: molybdopterin-dependent oxidoreductase [Chloroflexi bacterium]|uniref:Molybdopterin-dependent oxidoreductase n=1 Tax=Candidatus Chlorohelix allophototropha TaxID=3003348 RepID=A0A8T7M2Z9_9CHLR|nr:molybdopterin-dependent oxidoreductase [Chloroflexota bacterium]WJW67625.1 molybdopterin-dependent oxidoreductase [Chloroflexota bacterium L227-S17]